MTTAGVAPSSSLPADGLEDITVTTGRVSPYLHMKSQGGSYLDAQGD